MEVHHHPHIEKKKFKEYFLEFIMIFLAVTLGFFAEQLRENYKEKRQAKEYIFSFYEDLKIDTARVSALIQFDHNKIDGLKNIGACYDSISKNIACHNCLLTLFRNSNFNSRFQITERTLKQLDNAGGFRLLQKEDADSIMNYETNFNQVLDFQSTIFQEAQDNVRNTYNLLINFRANEQIHKPEKGFSGLYQTDNTTPLLLSDKILLNKYFNELILYGTVTDGQVLQLNRLKKKQDELIYFFKKKYHFQ